MMELRRRAVVTGLALLGLFYGFSVASAEPAPDDSARGLQHLPRRADLDAAALPAAVAAPETVLSGLGAFPHGCGLQSVPDTPVRLPPTAETVLVSASLFEKYRAFHESLRTP